jgi:molybdenum cofactor cytidylyltransferase
MTFAVIPAGGKSSRMGRPKLALPVAGRTVLELVIDALRRGGIQHILVVAGPHVPELVPLAQTSGAQVHLLGQETTEMRATFEAGLCCLEERYHPEETDCWLLAPADHPTLEAEVVRKLLQAAEVHPHHSLFIPTFQGRRGHPALVRWNLIPGLRALPAGQGINAYFRQCAAATFELPWETESILLDLDTPEDYQRILKRHEN